MLMQAGRDVPSSTPKPTVDAGGQEVDGQQKLARLTYFH